MATEDEVAEAFLAHLNSLGAVAYDYDQIPVPRPAWYTEVTVTRRFGGVQRGSGVRDGVLYRATLRQVAKTVSNARLLRSRAAALVDVPLVVGSYSTPVDFESSDPIGPDDGWYSGPESYTFALI